MNEIVDIDDYFGEDVEPVELADPRIPVGERLRNKPMRGVEVVLDGFSSDTMTANWPKPRSANGTLVGWYDRNRDSHWQLERLTNG